MKVLIVSTSDLQGGAAIAAYRLLNALTKAGIDARMAVRDKQSANNLVVKIGSDRRNKLNLSRTCRYLYPKPILAPNAL